MRRNFYVAALLLASCVLTASAAGSGQALQLGLNGRVRAALPTTSSTNITFEMWIRPTADTFASHILIIGDGNNKGYGIYLNDGTGYPGGHFSLNHYRKTINATGTEGKIANGEWTHIAVTRGASEWKLYRNGTMIGRSTLDPNAPDGFLQIGPDFKGQIDEVRVWERERTHAEILETMGKRLIGNEDDLVVYYDMDNEIDAITHNRATATGSSMDGVITGSATFVDSELPFTDARPPAFSTQGFPAHMQFLPRNSSGFGEIEISGQVSDTGFDSVALEITREGAPYGYLTMPLSYSSGTASFAFDTLIRSELAEYSFRLYAIVGADGYERILLAEALDVVAGDVFLIAGQSNAHATNQAETYRNRFLRSFGIQTTAENMDPYDAADTTWGLANAHGYGGYASGPMLTGIWGIYLQRLISENQEIPVCIINGGAGGSTIAQNLRASDPYDPASAYGRMLYRAETAGLRTAAKALFWYHGESDSITGYANTFRELHDAWVEDYTGLEKIYVFQIRPGCVQGHRHGALREYQRTLPDSFPDVAVIATVGLDGHEGDGCHFSLAGYSQMADMVYALVARDIYGSDDTVAVDAPSIRQAFFTDANHDEIALVFDGENHGIVWPADKVVAGSLRSMTEAFFLDGTPADITEGRSTGDTVYLKLSAPTTATTITYVPEYSWYYGTRTVFEGPWLVNSRGVGVFAFYQQPIVDLPTTSVPAVSEAYPGGVRIVPNPASTHTTIRFANEGSKVVDISILDMRGNLLREHRASGVGEVSLDLSALPAGVYLCRVGNVHRIFSIVR